MAVFRHTCLTAQIQLFSEVPGCLFLSFASVCRFPVFYGWLRTRSCSSPGFASEDVMGPAEQTATLRTGPACASVGPGQPLRSRFPGIGLARHSVNLNSAHVTADLCSQTRRDGLKPRLTQPSFPARPEPSMQPGSDPTSVPSPRAWPLSIHPALLQGLRCHTLLGVGPLRLSGFQCLLCFQSLAISLTLSPDTQMEGEEMEGGRKGGWATICRQFSNSRFPKLHRLPHH